MKQAALVGFLLGSLTIGSLVSTANSQLSELQKARAENYVLKRRLLTSECQAGIQSLETERTKLETELIAAQSCEAGWNWDTLTCAKPNADTPKEEKP